MTLHPSNPICCLQNDFLFMVTVNLTSYLFSELAKQEAEAKALADKAEEAAAEAQRIEEKRIAAEEEKKRLEKEAQDQKKLSAEQVKNESIRFTDFHILVVSCLILLFCSHRLVVWQKLRNNSKSWNWKKLTKLPRVPPSRRR